MRGRPRLWTSRSGCSGPGRGAESSRPFTNSRTWSGWTPMRRHQCSSSGLFPERNRCASIVCREFGLPFASMSAASSTATARRLYGRKSVPSASTSGTWTRSPRTFISGTPWRFRCIWFSLRQAKGVPDRNVPSFQHIRRFVGPTGRFSTTRVDGERWASRAGHRHSFRLTVILAFLRNSATYS